MGNTSGSMRPTNMFHPAKCVPGRAEAIPHAPGPKALHYTLKTPLHGPFPSHLELATFGMGCFWCSESLFLHKANTVSPGSVYSSAVGYSNGVTPNPTYSEVSSGTTNHNEVVRLVFDPAKLPYRRLLQIFFEGHDPTTPCRQGNDCGTQYRSGIYVHSPEQRTEAVSARTRFAAALRAAGRGDVVTEIEDAGPFYFAEEAHQQYDEKPGARQYCGLVPTGVRMPDVDSVQ
eukprot:TRINITY_DN27195_c0_g1_i1.p1 TRINITY_DN27195_c0_g1~~TRINITY_DN27195_c0_g1_i1.p1  ORF type:complete len:254 (-),score=28.80 TRINITY_DN27195_c0_g1_i1:273-965(-)